MTVASFPDHPLLNFTFHSIHSMPPISLVPSPIYEHAPSPGGRERLGMRLVFNSLGMVLCLCMAPRIATIIMQRI